MKKEFLQERLRERFSVKARSPVLILGLGLHGGGVGAASFFARLGYSVTVTDLKAKKELLISLKKLRGLPIKYILGKHRMEDIKRSKLIVKNPGIPASSPYVIAAQKYHIPVTNDGELFMELAPRKKVIGITGTKGKTTTAMLVGRLLGKEAFVVGVPGVSFFDYFDRVREPKWIVAEFSSFDLEFVKKSPHIAVFTSLFPDHLDRYPTFKKYASAKMNIVRHQTSGDVAIFASSPNTRSQRVESKSKVIWVDLGSKKYRAPWPTSHNSVALAARVGEILGFTQKTIQGRFHSFRPPKGRLEIIYRTKNQIYINDTTSTNPGAAMHSIKLIEERFGKQKPIIVITGGEDKSFPAEELKTYAEFLQNHAIRAVFLKGSMTEKLKKYLPHFEKTYTSMQNAVRAAQSFEGIIVLLPAAASFNMFRDEFDRGEKFLRAIHHNARAK